MSIRRRIGRQIQRWIDILPWRKHDEETVVDPEPQPPPPPLEPEPEPVPPEPEPEPEPAPPPAPEPPIKWFERGGKAILQIRADFRARGRGIITAHHHVHIIPESQTHDAWVAAVTRTPPERRVGSYDEWTLPFSMDQIASRAAARAPGSGSIVMVFAKGHRDVAYFLFADREYPPNEVIQNNTNQEWRHMR